MMMPGALTCGASAVATLVVAGLLGACSHSTVTADGRWNATAAAAYLDERASWWTGWSVAARDHGTFCVSCHTALPYALSRATLRTVLSDEAPSLAEQKVFENVAKRVRLRAEIGPYYSDQKDGTHKTAESRGTEAVLNALILAVRDAERLSDDTRAAFEEMWALQQTAGENAGAWPWLDFGLSPWEAKGSEYYGAALAAAAVGSAPENYRSSPTIQGGLERLRDYLRRSYPTQSLFNRTVLLWAATKLPQLLDAGQRTALITEILADQRSDGGWSLATLTTSTKRADGTPLEMKSDGYATGLVAFALQQADVPQDTAALKQALAWLRDNQDKSDGSWVAPSLNKPRNPTSNIGRFMSDAATAYAVLALTEAERHSGVSR